MKKLLLIKSSVRDGRNADPVAELVQAEIKNYPDFEVSVADFKEMPLPFIDSEVLPSSEDFVAKDPNVASWLDMVENTDAVIILVAEYNHSYTPVIKNAIDWGFSQWNGKPVGLIGYGWVGGARATAHLRGVLGSTIEANALEPEANLRFMKEINTDGTVLDETATSEAVTAVLDAVKESVTEAEAVA